MEVTVTRVTPLYPHDVFVQWTVEDPENALAQFEVLRSGSPGGPFEVISSVLSDDSFSYTDKGVHLLGLATQVWYRVKATPVTGAVNAVLSPARTAEFSEDPLRGRVARKARYDLGVSLRRLNGVPILILKKKRFGKRCATCYDAPTKSVVLSSCTECYGTSYSGGYHSPIKIYGKLDPVAVQPTMGVAGHSERAIQGLTIADYPLVENEDVVIEVWTNRRFVVKKKLQTESSRVVIHQDLQVSELSRADAAYLIRVELSG